MPGYIQALRLSSKPQAAAKLSCTIDLVEVGPEGTSDDANGLFVKVLTERQTPPDLVKFLVELRRRLLERLGKRFFKRGCA